MLPLREICVAKPAVVNVHKPYLTNSTKIINKKIAKKMMKRSKLLLVTSAVLMVLVVAVWVVVSLSDHPHEGETVYNDLRICSMHPWITDEGESKCQICGMVLSKVDGYASGSPLPKESDLYTSTDNFRYVHLGPGEDPQTGNTLIPITESRFYQPRDPTNENNSPPARDSNDLSTSLTNLWTCGMHPEVISDEPGICPICQMELTPLKTGTAQGTGTTVTIDPITLQNIGVVTEPAVKRDMSLEIHSNGVIAVAEDSQVKVNSRVSGWADKLYIARTGDYVRRGQPLLELYSPELVTAQEEFLLALESADALMSSDMDRVANSRHSLVKAARRRMDLWNITEQQINALEQNREVHRTMTIVSPADGIVIHKNIIEGSVVREGMDLFTIADLDTIWMMAPIYEYEIPSVRKGDRVEVRSPYDPTLLVAGRVQYIYPLLDEDTRSVEVRVILPNPNLRMKPGMYVDARIFTRPKPNVLTVPKSAVIRSGEREIVFIALGEGRFEPRQVHSGIGSGNYTEILFGLTEGELVVTSAQFLLDSEARLQEAIHRRLQARARIGAGGGNVPESDMAPAAGHQH